MNKRETLLIVAMFIFSLFLSCTITNYDYDFFARIIVGENFIEHGVLPLKDFLSYTPTHNWYDHEWGSGVIFYLILKYVGPLGIVFFHTLSIFLVSFFVVRIQKLQKHSYPVSMIFMAVFIMLFCHLNLSLVRCQLFSFVGFAFFLYILEKTRKQNSNLIWLIPVVTIFWNNVHGGVVSGLGLLIIYAFGEFLQKRRWRKYLGVFAISAPLLVINPYGVKYLGFLLSATTKQRKYIVEWWPFFANRHVWYYLFPSLYSIFGVVVTIKDFIKEKKLDLTKLIIIVVTVYLGLAHVKMLSLSVIVVASFCYNDFVRLFREFNKLFKKIEKALYPSIIVLALFIPMFSPSCPRTNLQRFSHYEVEFLKLNQMKGNILVPFGQGSFVSYKLYPDNLIYMDGRYEEVYYDKELEMLRNFELQGDNWEDIITKYDTDILMISKGVDAYNALQQNPKWVHIYDGRCCGIFVKKENVKEYYIEPKTDRDYYRKTIFYSDYFGKELRKWTTSKKLRGEND